jgi:hypothetical protein
MNPITSATVSGVGQTPLGVVEGTWVVGFFTDTDAQQPMIMGTLPGVPSTLPTKDSNIGFQDVGNANYPKYTETDVNRLAVNDDDNPHNTLTIRKADRDLKVGVVQIDGIFEGVAQIPTDLDITSWDEPITPYNATYPHNHVHESEGGHIKEIDDSPGAERLFTQHSAGTFEEIHPDGSKVVKIVGDNYEIIAGKSQIHIQGDVNITTLGTVRELIKGDYHLEVEGNYTQKIHKNHRVKVGAGTGGGNLEEEINGNHSFQIMNSVKGRVKEDVDIVIDKNETRVVNGTSTLNIVDDYAITSLKSIDLIASDHLSATTVSGIMSYKSGGKLNMKSVNTMTIKSEL